MPAGEPLTLMVSLDCGNGNYQVVHTQQLGVLTLNTNVGLVVVANPNTTVVSGTVVGCNGQPLAQGYVLANSEPVFANGGQFSFSACTGGSMTLMGIDPLGNVGGASVTVSLAGVAVNAGELEACANSGLYTPGPGVTDQNGNSYTTIILNNGQEWMAENLRSTTYANGDPIPNVMNGGTWANLSTGAWAHYDNDSQYEYPYGKLYNWYAVADPRNVCPAGWHVPTDAEWTEFTDYLGGANVAGGKMKTIGTEYWNAPNTGATNESGFSGLPGGERSYNSALIGSYGTWWSASYHTSSQNAIGRSLRDDESFVGYKVMPKTGGLSVRCLRY